MRGNQAWKAGVACALTAAWSACPRHIVGDGAEGARVEVVRARFTSGDRGDFEIEFALKNPTGVAAQVTGIDWEIWLGPRWFAAGTLALSEPVPAEGAHCLRVKLPVVFRRSGTGNPEPTWIEIGVRGHLTLDASGHVQPLPFQDRRRILAENVPSLGGGIDEH